mgnify:CR=1 FL=1
MCVAVYFFFFQAEDGIRFLVRSRGLGDVYKRQRVLTDAQARYGACGIARIGNDTGTADERPCSCLLYTSDAADERSSVDLGGRRIIKKKNKDDC